MKLDSTDEAETKSFTWQDQDHLDSDAVGVVQSNYIIVPATFYKFKS